MRTLDRRTSRVSCGSLNPLRRSSECREHSVNPQGWDPMPVATAGVGPEGERAALHPHCVLGL